MKSNKKNTKNNLEQRANLYNERRKKGEPFNFEDFKFFIEMQNEFEFYCNDVMYEVTWCKNGLEFFRNQNKDYSSSDCELYVDSADFLANARINGKTLEEIFDQLKF